MRSIAIIACVVACSRPAPPAAAPQAAAPPAAAPAPPLENHATPAEDLSAVGAQVFVNKGCNSCHTTDGTSRIGRSMKGIWDTDVTLDDGHVAHVDAAYVHDALVAPQKYNLAGFPAGVMPTYAGMLKAHDIAALAAYIQSLK